MTVLGVDPSLTSTGVAYSGFGDQIVTHRIIPGKYLKGVSRLAFIKNSIESTMNIVFREEDENNLMVYEGYAMGAPKSGGRAFDMGELGGVLKTLAYTKGIPVLLVPPTSLKLFATGNGRAEKLDILQAVKDTWGYALMNDDEADAFVLYQMGRLFRSSKKVRASHRVQALESCQYIPGARIQ